MTNRSNIVKTTNNPLNDHGKIYVSGIVTQGYSITYGYSV